MPKLLGTESHQELFALTHLQMVISLYKTAALSSNILLNFIPNKIKTIHQIVDWQGAKETALEIG